MREILIVDDDDLMREKVIDDVRLYFTEEFSINTATNGMEAFRLLMKLSISNEVALVITDIEMPVRDGIELLKDIKSSHSLKKIPVLMLSSVNDQERIIDAIKNKATNYLLKPWTMEGLHEKLAFCLSHQWP